MEKLFAIEMRMFYQTPNEGGGPLNLNLTGKVLTEKKKENSPQDGL